LLVSPLLLLLIAAVRLDSKGPGFFVQTRVGKDGRLFRMVKLRTMYADAEAMKQALLSDNESDGVLFKIRRDPRVTRVGYWLRRSSLDELPQLLNVLLGQMSMVGPRPALPSEVAAYDGLARRRLAVKPGITGLWQVSGRSDLSWDESIRLDLHYADNWRLVDDLGIAVRTVSAVTQARGAY
jgi:lipopolysaccharide/colanic/teichoic acid biosynthesis glycosyltransferase